MRKQSEDIPRADVTFSRGPRLQKKISTASTGLRYPTGEQLVWLASDRSAEVRWAVLTRVEAPREALEIIAQDSDDMNRQHAERILHGAGVNSPGVIAQQREQRVETVHTDF